MARVGWLVGIEFHPVGGDLVPVNFLPRDMLDVRSYEFMGNATVESSPCMHE
jgi:hypothetical protein